MGGGFAAGSDIRFILGAVKVDFKGRAEIKIDIYSQITINFWFRASILYIIRLINAELTVIVVCFLINRLPSIYQSPFYWDSAF